MVEQSNIGKRVKVVKIRYSCSYSVEQSRKKLPHGLGMGVECHGTVIQEDEQTFLIRREDNDRLMSVTKEYCKIL